MADRRRELQEKQLNKMEKKNRRVKKARGIGSTLVYFVITIGLTLLFIQFIAQLTQVDGESMENTLYDEDSLIVDKITYRFKEPERYDIIVFPFHEDEELLFIKRIIGLPGERIRIEGDVVYVNGEVLDEGYGREVMEYAGVAETEIVLGTDEYFVLGDNRNNSADSRDARVGNIRKEEIVGKAWLRIWPLDRFGVINE